MHTKTKLTNHIIKSTLSIFLLPYYHSPQINTISFSMPPFVTLFPLFYEYSKLAYSLFFILLFCTIYKSRNTIFPHEIRLENKIMSPRIIHLVILQFLVFFRKNILMFHIANCIFFSLFFPLKWKVPCTGHGEPYHSPPDRRSNPFVPILWFHRAGCSFLRSHAISAFSV